MAGRYSEETLARGRARRALQLEVATTKHLSSEEIKEIRSFGNDRQKWADRFTHHGIRKYLPYGMWVTTDGEMVLYNRKYQPFLTRTPQGDVSGCDPKRWVNDIVMHYYFFNDGNPPNDLYRPSTGINKTMVNTFDRCCAVIDAFCAGAAVDELEKFVMIKKGFIDGKHQRLTFAVDGYTP